jgi:hypothetical protein
MAQRDGAEMTAPALKQTPPGKGASKAYPTEPPAKMGTVEPIVLQQQVDYKHDPDLVYCGKRIVFAGSYFDFLIYLTEQKTHLHERLGTQEIDTDGAMRIVNECRRRPELADLADFSEEQAIIDRLQETVKNLNADLDAAEWRETYQSLRDSL